jgi:hypothetical protein
MRTVLIADSSFVDFRRDHAAAIRGNPNTSITVQNTAFKRLTITPMQKPDEDPIKWARVFGSAVGLFENALLWIQVIPSPSYDPPRFSSCSGLVHSTAVLFLCGCSWHSAPA